MSQVGITSKDGNSSRKLARLWVSISCQDNTFVKGWLVHVNVWKYQPMDGTRHCTVFEFWLFCFLQLPGLSEIQTISRIFLLEMLEAVYADRTWESRWTPEKSWEPCWEMPACQWLGWICFRSGWSGAWLFLLDLGMILPCFKRGGFSVFTGIVHGWVELQITYQLRQQSVQICQVKWRKDGLE